MSALVGLGAATTHAGEVSGMNATGAAGLAASETHAGVASATGSAAAGGLAAAEGMVATHVVQVGGANGSIIFSPENVVANVGDLVQFQFYPKVGLRLLMSSAHHLTSFRTTRLYSLPSTSPACPSRT